MALRLRQLRKLRFSYPLLTGSKKIEINENHLPTVVVLVRGKHGLESNTHHLAQCLAVQVPCQALPSPMSPRS